VVTATAGFTSGRYDVPRSTLPAYVSCQPGSEKVAATVRVSFSSMPARSARSTVTVGTTLVVLNETEVVSV